MPHYLIQLSASSESTETMPVSPRAQLDRMRGAAAEIEGHLDSCWFTEDGQAMVTILHLPYLVEEHVIQEVLSQVWIGANQDVRRLLTLRELDEQGSEDVIRIETGLSSDPVDLGSYLSFPASDPPSWQPG